MESSVAPAKVPLDHLEASEISISVEIHLMIGPVSGGGARFELVELIIIAALPSFQLRQTGEVDRFAVLAPPNCDIPGSCNIRPVRLNAASIF